MDKKSYIYTIQQIINKLKTYFYNANQKKCDLYPKKMRFFSYIVFFLEINIEKNKSKLYIICQNHNKCKIFQLFWDLPNFIDVLFKVLTRS